MSEDRTGWKQAEGHTLDGKDIWLDKEGAMLLRDCEERRIVFVEFESESGDEPVSWTVYATPEQEERIEKLVTDSIPEDYRPYVGEISPMKFEDFMAAFQENWGDIYQDPGFAQATPVQSAQGGDHE